MVALDEQRTETLAARLAEWVVWANDHQGSYMGLVELVRQAGPFVAELDRREGWEPDFHHRIGQRLREIGVA